MVGAVRGLCGPLIAAGRSSSDGLFYRLTRFAGALLDASDQFLLLAFDVLQIVVREFGPLLLQVAFNDVPVAFDFECCHGDVGWMLVVLRTAFLLIRRHSLCASGKPIAMGSNPTRACPKHNW